MNVIENNRLIAEFMGLQGQHEEWCGNNVLEMDEFVGSEQMRPYNPDKNWSDLMPVVEKIQDLGYSISVNFEGKQLACFTNTVIGNATLFKEPIVYGNSEKDAKYSIYQAVIEFIQFYNTTSPTKK